MENTLITEMGIVDGFSEDDRFPNPEQIKICAGWLVLHATRTTYITRAHTSYGLKHRVERWTRVAGPHKLSDILGNKWVSDYYYISNGAFITAAIQLGYTARRADNTPNAYFNFRVKKEKR